MVRFLTLGTLGVALYGMLLFLLWSVSASIKDDLRGAIKYDCSLASIHPDYPAKVRKACREAR